MVAVIAVQAVGLWRAWEKKVAGARLHARIVGLFSLIAALPALLLAIAATTTFSRALDNWFNQQTMSIVQNSLNVAHAYLDEHGQVIRTDIVNMAKDLDDAAPQVGGRPAQVPRADVRAGRPARPSGGLRRRCQGRGEGGRARGREDPLHRPARASDPRRRRRAGAAADAERHLPRRGASPSCTTIPTPISTSPAASTRRSSSICGAPRPASSATKACARSAAASSSRTG